MLRREMNIAEQAISAPHRHPWPHADRKMIRQRARDIETADVAYIAEILTSFLVAIGHFAARRQHAFMAAIR